MSILTLGGKTPRELGLHVLRQSQRPILPSTIDSVISIPGLNGSLDFGAYQAPRIFEFDCAFLSRNSRSLQLLVSGLAKHLMDSNGRPRSMEMILIDQPNRKYTVRLSGELPIDRIVGMGRFNLPLVAYDPFAYATVTNNEITWGSETITFDSDFLMGDEGGDTKTITSGTSLNVVMSGYVTQRPTITLVGSGSNVTIEANGNSFTIGSLDGATWVINGSRRQVSKNGINALSSFDGDFIELVTGDNTITVSGSSMNFTLQTTFRDKYL